jgi:hypothetical protein
MDVCPAGFSDSDSMQSNRSCIDPFDITRTTTDVTFKCAR